jgi:ABC-type transporter Mla maintaining outer membrane lipid asymmetry ATPase subunit MlaF
MSRNSSIQLCPAQKRTFEGLSGGLEIGSILRLWGGVGRGKSTILKELHKQAGGVLLNVKDFVNAATKNHPLALEETLYQLLLDALKTHAIVILDDV